MRANSSSKFADIFMRSGKRGVLIGSLILASTMFLIVGIMLSEVRKDAWKQARQTSDNLKQAIISDVQSQLNRYDQALEFAVGEFSGVKFQNGVTSEKQHLLERMARNADIIGSVLVLNEEGDSVAQSGSSTPSNENFSDREYFAVHQDAKDVGLYVSRPFANRLRNDDPSIALSRRISDVRGNFAGVVVIAVRLEHFHKMLARLAVGERSGLAIIRGDGLILSRQPASDGGSYIGRDVSQNEAFQLALANGSSTLVSVGIIDNTEKLFNVASVPGFPLFVSVAFAKEDILAGWWKLAVVIVPTTLLVCGAIVALAVLLQTKIERLAATEARLETLATTDGLTGLANRRYFDAAVEVEWNRARRDGTSLSILLIDADRFKLVNDQFGHLKGDDVLKAIARRVENRARRAGDLAARFGGEEFILLLPATRASAALSVAEAIRSDVLAASTAAKAAGEPGTTVSLGVATMAPDKSNSIEKLLVAADQALYQAKAEGRNRTVLASAVMAMR